MKKNKKFILTCSLVILAAILIATELWLNRVHQHKMYAQGAIDEYARVQKVPKNTIKKLTVAYDFKSNAWAAFTTVHVDGKPYQIEYWIDCNDVKNRRPEILFSVFHKEGEGWEELNDKAERNFKYKPLYDYQ